VHDKHKSTWCKEVVGRLAPAVYSEVQDLSRHRRARSTTELRKMNPRPPRSAPRGGFQFGHDYQRSDVGRVHCSRRVGAHCGTDRSRTSCTRISWVGGVDVEFRRSMLAVYPAMGDKGLDSLAAATNPTTVSVRAIAMRPSAWGRGGANQLFWPQREGTTWQKLRKHRLPNRRSIYASLWASSTRTS